VVFLVRRLVFARLARLRGQLEERAAAQGLPPSRVVELQTEDEIGRLEGLFRRVIFPSRGRKDPEGGAPESASDRGR
jgi:hypothetical protein